MSPFEMEAGLKTLIALAGETLRELRDSGALTEAAIARIGARTDEAAGHMDNDFGVRVLALVMAHLKIQE